MENLLIFNQYFSLQRQNNYGIENNDESRPITFVLTFDPHFESVQRMYKY